MPNAMPNLWPEDLGGEDNFVTPAAVLKEAAAQLGERTHHLVTASVNTFIRGDSLYHSFWIEVPTLDYRYKLFELHHAVDGFYPLTADEWVQGRYLEIGSEDELKEYLKKVFAAEKTRKLVDTLLKQVRS
jgi:hypothetical protein